MPEKENSRFPSLIRVSIGTAVVLGLASGKLDAEPTTAYLMTYRLGKCKANCGFCPQARESESNAELLSRVTWATMQTAKVLEALGKCIKQGKIRRVCIQALNFPQVFEQVGSLVEVMKKEAPIPVSVSCQPQNRSNIELLKRVGVDRIGVALDAATEKLFNRVKGAETRSPYRWDKELLILSEALEVFGKGNVSTHLIIGLGESEQEATETIQKAVDMGVLPALFAFTPVRGTALENRMPPNLQTYRRVQLARFLIVQGAARAEQMRFDAVGRISGFGLGKEVLGKAILSGEPFLTSGCSDCNRPFYNEKPSGPIYNFPRKPTSAELEFILQHFEMSA